MVFWSQYSLGLLCKCGKCAKWIESHCNVIKYYYSARTGYPLCAGPNDVKFRYELIVSMISKTKHNKLKVSPVVGPRTLVDPANGSSRQMTDDMDVQNFAKKVVN